jgi:hypothetical protein
MLKNFNHIRGRSLAKNIIKQSPLDEDFRRHTSELLSSAKKDILIIAGEVGSFKFLDLRRVAKRLMNEAFGSEYTQISHLLES